MNRRARSGAVIGGNQRIGVEEAIRAYAVGGAYTSHEEGRKGQLIAGQWADLVVLDQDPTTIDPAQLSSIKTMMTIVGGKIAYQR